MVKVIEKFETSDSDYHYTAGYYTTNKWLDNDTIVAIRSKNPLVSVTTGEKCELVKLCLSTGEKALLCDDVRGYEACVVHEDKVYYSSSKDIKVIDVKTGKSKILFAGEELTDGINSYFSMPDITADGKYLNTYIQCEGKPSRFLVIDTKNGKVKTMFEKEFAAPFDLANHSMVCPTDPDIVFFAHEGKTRYVSNRLWIHDAKTGEMYNLAKQKLDENGNLGDCFGHEMWAPHGKGMYFVKYPCSPVPPRGICYVDLETREHMVLYTKYPYWHAGVSQDGKYLLADTQTNDIDSMVVVIDKSDNSETVIDEVKVKVHPAHPHPQMSPDNKKIIYTAINKEGRVCIVCSVLE